MQFIKSIFDPFTVLPKRWLIILTVIELAFALLAWELMATGGLIPRPSKIAVSTLALVGTETFIDNLLTSLTLTVKGMGIAILIALVVCYMSVVPVFYPIARFVVKCRYLTLTGLIFLFTLLTASGHQLKLSLLIFGIVPFFVTSLLSIIDEINAQEFELCKTLRMNNWQTLWEVIIVGRLDMVVEVVRQNFAIAWMMITLVEGLNMSEGGLGSLLIKSNKYIDLGTVFGLLLVIFLLGVLFDYLLKQFRFWIFPYARLTVRK